MNKPLFAATGLILALFASPAQAHDLLVDISPAPGEVVSSSSFEAILTFDNPLLVIESQTNAELSIKLVGSEDWQNQPIVINDRTLTAQIGLVDPGSYDLRWKVVSSDGHPINGESNFVFEGIESEPGVEFAITTAETEAAPGSDEIPPGFYIGLLMVALGAVFAPIGLMMRRRAKKS